MLRISFAAKDSSTFSDGYSPNRDLIYSKSYSFYSSRLSRCGYFSGIVSTDLGFIESFNAGDGDLDSSSM